MFVNSIANKYGISLNVAGSLISDNLVTLIFGLAVFFITGYAFYDAQKSAINNDPRPPQNTNFPMGGQSGPDSSSVFGNLYSNSYKQQNMGGTQNINNMNNNEPNNANGNNSYDSTSETSGAESDKPSGSSMFTLKKD